MRSRIYVLLLSVLALAAPVAAANDEKIQVLLLSGQNNHDCAWTSAHMFQVLVESGRFQVDLSNEPGEALADAERVAKYDVFLLDYNGERWGEPAEQNFLDAVRGGTGVAVIHAANNAFPGWVEYEKIVGHMWRQGTGHGRFHAFDVEMKDREHPITRNLPDLKAHPDELYHNLVHMHGAEHRVLATAMSSKESGGTGKEEPMILVGQYGEGRIFHTPLGHVWRGQTQTQVSHLDPQFKTLLKRGVEWAATGDVAEDRKEPVNVLTDEERAAGWQLLFDGETTRGWRGFKKDAFPDRGWKVEDGTLRCVAGGGGGDVITEKMYGDYEFRFDFKVAPRANSGVIFRCDESAGTSWQTGPEYQVLDDAGHGGGGEKTSTGSLYDLVPARNKVLAPAGQWNSGAIRIQDGLLQHFVNGGKVLEVRIDDEGWDALIAGSKFKNYAKFGRLKKGHIALQDHGNDVWFRNLKVRPLGEKGAVRLFNGRDLSGWTYHLNGDAKMDDVWRVEDGILICGGRPAGYIRTEKDYTNYVLEVEWRFNPVTKQAGNSGVLLRMIGPDKVWPRSVEAQLMSGRAGDFWNIDQFPMQVAADRTNGRHTRHTHANENPIGEWNRYRITVDGGLVVLEVNGQELNRATDVMEVPGKICLQSEGAEIQFRSIVLHPIERGSGGGAEGEEEADSFGRSFRVPDGLEAKLWAESPLIYNPTCMDVDARGRLWVAEGVNYRTWGGRNPGRRHPEGDRIMILADEDGDGRADTSKVFVQDEDLVAPLGLAVIGDRVFVSSSPKLLVYRDTDGDDVADEKEVLLEGFGGPDHDHGLHSVVLGVDGRLYFNTGNAGPHVVTDRAGWTLRSGSIYSGGGAVQAANLPGMISDDGRVWVGGLILRMQPDATGLEVLAHNFRNNYEVAVDSFGDLYQSDNDDDGNESCRTLWCMEGGNHGYFAADGSRSWQADRRPGQDTQRAHWHADDPGVVPFGTINGAGGPTGVCVYEEGLLPEHFRGAVFNADAGRNVVYSHLPVARGAGFELQRTELIRATGPSGPAHDPRWFRPSDVCVGTEGAVYVADWYDPGVGGHAARDREAYGRIVRIAPKGDATAPREVDLSSPAADALASPATNVRNQAVARFAEGPGGRSAESIAELLRADDAFARARAVWIAARRVEHHGLVEAALAEDPDARVRVAALRALRNAGYDAARLRPATRDASPLVRRELALALRDLSADEALGHLLELIEGFDGEDRYYLEALGIACEGKEEAVYALLSEAFPNSQAWPVPVASLVWRLHPPAAIDALERRALTDSLAVDQRLQALDALAFIRDCRAADAVVRIASEGGPELRRTAAWWLGHRDANDWSDCGTGPGIAAGDFDPSEAVFRSPLLTKGLHEARVDITGATVLCLEVEDGPRGNGYDWANWIEPTLVGPAGELRLTDLPWTWAEAEWGEVRLDKNAGGGPIRVEGESYWGIGTHAYSQILFQLPEGKYTELVTRFGPDDGGTQQPGSTTDVEFRVYTDVARAQRLAGLREALLDGASAEDRVEAGLELAEDPQGAMVLIELAARDRLPEDLRAAVADAIHRNPDVGVRGLASRHFPRRGRPADFPSLDALAAVPGDVHRGRELFFSTAVSCSRCHTFNGNGGRVGPDLTALRAKAGRKEVLDSILNPSAAVLMGYESWVIEDADGLIHGGFLEQDGDKVVLRRTDGRRIVLDRDEVVSRRRETHSVMPDDVSVGLGPQDLADLASFLLESPVKGAR